MLFVYLSGTLILPLMISSFNFSSLNLTLSETVCSRLWNGAIYTIPSPDAPFSASSPGLNICPLKLLVLTRVIIRSKAFSASNTKDVSTVLGASLFWSEIAAKAYIPLYLSASITPWPEVSATCNKKSAPLSI